jgi:hypothetical protein
VQIGYHPEIILLGGGRLNDSAHGRIHVHQVVKLMIKISVNGATVLMLGILLRKTVPMFAIQKMVDVIAADYGIAVTTYDPIANPSWSKKYNLVTKKRIAQTAI